MSTNSTEEQRRAPALQLTAEEQRLLDLHKRSRPASVYEKKAKVKRAKKRRFYRKPGFYAIALAVLGIFVTIGIGILAAGVSQATDIDAFVELTQDESVQNLAEAGGVDSGWFDFAVWMQANLLSIMLGTIGFFLLCAAIVLVAANVYRNSQRRNDAESTTGTN